MLFAGKLKILFFLRFVALTLYLKKPEMLKKAEMVRRSMNKIVLEVFEAQQRKSSLSDCLGLGLQTFHNFSVDS